MKSILSRALVVLALTATAIVIGCDANVDGSYRDPEGGMNIVLKDGKATMDIGQTRIGGNYTVDGDTVTISPEGARTSSDVLVLTVGKDGALLASPEHPNPIVKRLDKVK